MSDTGVYLGVYSRIQRFAELLDSVLVELKSPSTGLVSADRDSLAKTLISFEQRDLRDPSLLLLQAVLRADERQKVRLIEIGRALLNPAVFASTLPQLEQMARLLENERATTFLKMRGSP